MTRAFWMTDRNLDIVRREISEGRSSSYVAKMIGATKNQVIGWCYRNGVKLLIPAPAALAKQPLPDHHADAFRIMWHGGSSKREIASALKIDERSVTYFAGKMGLRVKTLPPLASALPLKLKAAPKPKRVAPLPDAPEPVIIHGFDMRDLRLDGGRGCQFIEGHGRPWRKCFDPVSVPAGSWCRTHFRTVFNHG